MADKNKNNKLPLNIVSFVKKILVVLIARKNRNGVKKLLSAQKNSTLRKL